MFSGPTTRECKARCQGATSRWRSMMSNRGWSLIKKCKRLFEGRTSQLVSSGASRATRDVSGGRGTARGVCRCAQFPGTPFSQTLHKFPNNMEFSSRYPTGHLDSMEPCVEVQVISYYIHCEPHACQIQSVADVRLTR
jgi:hypothetical protein